VKNITVKLLIAGFLVATLALAPQAQQNSASAPVAALGDEPEQELPLATYLSPAIRREDVQRAMRKVADWQLERSRSGFNLDWTFAALYTGFIAASQSTGDEKYRQAMYEMGKAHDWQLGPRLTHADDQAVAQTYLDLYLEHPKAAEIATVKEHFDRIMAQPVVDGKLPWWWCDALFMAPPVWARLYKATGDIRYLDYMDHQWWATSALLYDNSEHLFSRDSTFLDKRDKNGSKIFWSRGNGWVMAGLVRVLQSMPANYPDRQQYLDQFREMCAAIAKLQGSDGLWRPGLLDAAAYPLPEVSGSAFFTYALAWGVNQSVLDRKVYRPVVQHAWKGLLGHIYADGRLGCIQPIGAAPGDYRPTASYVFGVGAFLLAGSEVDRMADGAHALKLK
jgi:rhamnogalacturonyl hydrolase YesR